MPWDKDPSTVTMTLADEAPSKGRVAAKWRGTHADQADMSALGREQVLRVCLLSITVTSSSVLTLQRNFRYISIVGFGCTLIATWEVVLTYAIHS